VVHRAGGEPDGAGPVQEVAAGAAAPGVTSGRVGYSAVSGSAPRCARREGQIQSRRRRGRDVRRRSAASLVSCRWRWRTRTSIVSGLTGASMVVSSACRRWVQPSPTARSAHRQRLRIRCADRYLEAGFGGIGIPRSRFPAPDGSNVIDPTVGCRSTGGDRANRLNPGRRVPGSGRVGRQVRCAPAHGRMVHRRGRSRRSRGGPR
jgi:hypothetical protein